MHQRASPVQTPTMPITTFFVQKDWAQSEKKPCKELKPFDGMSANYEHWQNRIRDHCQLVNPSWRRILDFIDAEQKPISWHVLRSSRIDVLGPADLINMAQILYSFVGMHMTEAVYPRREALAGGEGGSRFELWRRL